MLSDVVNIYVPAQIVTTGATTNVWPTWNVQWDTGTSGSGSTIVTSNTIVWNQCVTTGNTITSSTPTVWTNWNGQYGTSVTIQAYGSPLRAETDAEKTARLARERLYADERTKREAEQKSASRRAKKLLVDHLDEGQRKTYAERGFFYLYTRSGKKYRIDQGTHGNVKLVDETNRVLGQYCGQPLDVPAEDAMLAQKLFLEIDEEEFKRKANFRAAA